MNLHNPNLHNPNLHNYLISSNIFTFLVCFSLLFPYALKSQPANKLLGDVAMPSAEALSGAKYGEIPISYFTGVPNVAVPLHTISEGSLQIPLSLNYHASGVKVGELASWVGSNWSLQLGMVSRTVLGTPDDISNGYYDNNGDLVQPMLENNATSTQQMLESARGQRDTEPDLFHATLPGYGNVKWLYDKDNNVVQLPKTDFKIEVHRENGTSGRFTGFTITSPTGVQFIFGKLANDTGLNDGMEYTYYDGIQVNLIAPSGWYLREVRSQDHKDIISYHYSAQKYAYKHLSSCSIDYSNGVMSNCGNGITIGTNKKVINNKIDGFRLDSILCSVGAIKFIANTDREDVETYTAASTETAQRLNRIEINNGAFCKAFDFHYSYPESLSGNTTPENKRLRLDSLQEISCNGLAFKPKYKFDYFAGKLPDRYSKQIDSWGFFNGAIFNENKLNIPPVSVLWQGSFVTPPSANADRNPKLAQTKIGSLQKITYPTGGHTAFDFELNETKELTTIGGGDLIVFGELSNCSSPFSPECCSVDSQTDTMTFTSNQLNGATYKLTAYDFVEPSFCTDPINYLVKVEIKEYGQTAILGTISFNSCADSTCSMIEPLSNLAMLSAGVKYEFNIELTASSSLTGFAKATFAINNQSQTTASFTPKKVGGLRLKEWRQHDGNDPNKDIVRTYDYSESESSTLSSGLLYQTPRYWGYQKSFDGTAQGLTFQATSVAPLTNTNGYTIGYRRVVEQTNGAGKSEYLFNAEAVVPTSFDEFPYTPDKLRAYDGIALKTIHLNTAGDSLAISSTARDESIGYQQLSGHIIYRAYEYFINGNNYLYAKPYTIRTGVYLLGEKHETLDGVTTVTKYDYDPTNHLAPTLISTTNSDGIEYITENDYIFDFPSSDPVYAEMNNRNLIRPIIESRVKMKKNGVETQIGGRRTTYSPYSKTTGLIVGSCCNDADPYPNNISEYEMTWDAAGNVVLGDANEGSPDGWVLEVLYSQYDLNTGQPTKILPLGWSNQEYTYDAISKQRTSSQFIDHEKKINYYAGSSILSSITAIDGQRDSIEWDALIRPKRVLDRAENIIHTYDYGYLGNGDGQNFFKLTTDFTLASRSDLQQTQVVSYKDGLNRVTQQVQTKHSPNALDVITAQAYDNQGRIIKQYEPFESALNTGAFQAVPANTPFTQMDYESSPLHRDSAVTPPEWYPTLTTYGKNEQGNIRDHYNLSFYNKGELFTKTITDPNGNRTTSFTDKNGRTILVRRDSIGSPYQNDTYTSFDPKNRKVLILPPGTELHPIVAAPELVYTYIYDHLDQVIEQKIPSKTAIEIIYEPNRDYPVAWRGGNLKADGKWMVTAYDDYGRPTQTGLITNTGTPDPINLLPTEIWTKTFWDGQASASFTGFADLTAPKDLPSELQAIFEAEQANLTPADNSSNPIYQGKVHYTETAILTGNTASNNHLLSINRYDAYGRIDRIQTDNHLGGFDNTLLYYDFADNQTRATRFHRHQALSANIITDNKDEFDHQGRQIKNEHLITGVGVFSNEICRLEYDVKDLLKTKHLGGNGSGGFLQEVNYEYLPNRFLTGINSNASASDLFVLFFNYDLSNPSIGAVAQYNGNISGLSWFVKGGSQQTYTYQYDFLNRLTAANYNSPNNDYGTTYSYDDRGNFTHITRRGVHDNGNSFAAQQIDNMAFMPYSGTNQIKTITDAAPCPTDKTIHQTLDHTELHAVEETVLADNTINETGVITYQAGTSITLQAGFHAKAGTNFTARIDDCPQSGFETAGFVQRSSNDYLYDAEGNQTSDPNKGTTIQYNYLNLPYEVSFDNDNVIEWLYLANGAKVQKAVKRDGLATPILKQDYIGGIEYQNDTLEAIYLTDGRLAFEEGDFKEYQYYLRDHLGNNRVVFKDDGSGVAEVVQESHFYPFGMAMKGEWGQTKVTPEQNYLYNGKELDTDFGLDWYHYGFRMYDPAIGRFTGVDPISDKFPALSTFNYASNNPISNIDLHGLQGVDVNDPMPSVAGILFEGFQNARAGLFNMEMRAAEFLGYGDENTSTRMRVNYDADGFIPVDNPVSVVKEQKKGFFAETMDAGLDVLSMSPLAELGAARGASGVFMAARTPSSIIPSIAKQFDNFQCVDCADAIMDALKQEGISGEIVTLQARGRMDTQSGNVWSDTAGKNISTNGHHRGVLVDGKVYDNIHTEGIDYNAWKNDFYSIQGIDFNN